MNYYIQNYLVSHYLSLYADNAEIHGTNYDLYFLEKRLELDLDCKWCDENYMNLDINKTKS